MSRLKKDFYLKDNMQVNNILKKSGICPKTIGKKNGIKKTITLHWLRHSYATHLLENGTDLRYIQELLGYNSSKTTEIYTHVSTKNIQNIKSPFDNL
jgi:site-specific recombinase XerD